MTRIKKHTHKPRHKHSAPHCDLCGKRYNPAITPEFLFTDGKLIKQTRWQKGVKRFCSHECLRSHLHLCGLA